jgi:hypothetical protein
MEVAQLGFEAEFVHCKAPYPEMPLNDAATASH